MQSSNQKHKYELLSSGECFYPSKVAGKKPCSLISAGLSTSGYRRGLIDINWFLTKSLSGVSLDFKNAVCGECAAGILWRKWGWLWDFRNPLVTVFAVCRFGRLMLVWVPNLPQTWFGRTSPPGVRGRASMWCWSTHRERWDNTQVLPPPPFLYSASDPVSWLFRHTSYTFWLECNSHPTLPTSVFCCQFSFLFFWQKI